MPIDIEEFEATDGVRRGTTSERLLKHLRDHDEQAFTRRELADAIGSDPETVGTNLSRLKDRGLVRHRSPYWAIDDDGDESNAPVSENGARSGRSTESTVEDGSTETADSTHRSDHRAAAEDFFERVRNQIQGGVAALYLFGSVARDAATSDSDVDVLAVISADAAYDDVDDRLLDVAYDVQLDHGVRVEVHSIRESEFTARKADHDPFVETVLQEGEVGA